MGVGVLGEGGDVSRHEKKEKKGGRTLYALPVAFLCPFDPSWTPLVRSVVSVAFSTRRGLLDTTLISRNFDVLYGGNVYICRQILLHLQLKFTIIGRVIFNYQLSK